MHITSDMKQSRSVVFTVFSVNFNSIGSGVSEPQVAKNRYLPVTGGIALTTVYALTCYTVISCHFCAVGLRSAV